MLVWTQGIWGVAYFQANPLKLMHPSYVVSTCVSTVIPDEWVISHGWKWHIPSALDRYTGVWRFNQEPVFLGCRFLEFVFSKGHFTSKTLASPGSCFFVLRMGQVQQVVASKNRCYQPSQHQLAPTSGLFWLVGWLNHWAMFFLFWKVGRWLVGGDALNRSILVIQMGTTIQSPWGNFDTSLFRDVYGHGSKPIILDFWGIYIDSDPSYFHVHHVTMCTDNWNGTKVCPG